MIVLVTVLVASLLLSTSAAAAPAPVALGAPGYHRVRLGETVFSIGRLYGVNPWAIVSANHLADANKIYAGQVLHIPYGPGPHPGPGPKPGPGPHPGPAYRYHVVRCGETLHSIGRMYGKSAWTIAAANGIYNLNYIYAGQRLVIP
jgi:LysM repeat protein